VCSIPGDALAVYRSGTLTHNSPAAFVNDGNVGKPRREGSAGAESDGAESGTSR